MLRSPTVKKHHISVIAAAVLAVGVFTLWLVTSRAPAITPDANDAGVTQDKHRAAPKSPDSSPRVTAKKLTAKKTGVGKKEHERYRRAIRESIAKRGPRRRYDEDETGTQGEDSTGGPPDGSLRDRSDGTLSDIARELESDVMPLVSECYDQALERDPAFAGGLELRFEIIGDQDVGGLVESVAFGEASEIRDPGMLECMRETLLSTLFAPPEDSGSTGVELTFAFAPNENKEP